MSNILPTQPSEPANSHNQSSQKDHLSRKEKKGFGQLFSDIFVNNQKLVIGTLANPFNVDAILFEVTF